MKKLFVWLCLFPALLAGTTLKAQPVITNQPVAAAEFIPNGSSNPTTYNSNSCLYLGNTANLSIVASGTGTLSYQWTWNGAAIAGATSTNYALNQIQASQAGAYACVVSNSSGSVTSSVVTAQPWAQMSWQGPTTFSSDSVLTLTDNPPVLEANAFGGTAEIVTNSTTGVVIDFKGDSSAVATVNQNGQYNAFAGVITGNAQLDAVLDEGSYDGPIEVDGNGCKIITFKNLTPGNPYSVLLVGLDDRSCCDDRVVWFQDAYDYANITTNFTMGANDYVIGSFIAGGTTETVNEVLQGGSGNIMCLVVYEITNAPQFPTPLTAFPSATNDSGITVTLSPGSLLGQLPFTYQWQSVTVAATNNISTATNSTLTLPDTTTTNSGDYRLVVKNSFGSVTSALFALTIKPFAPPTFFTNLTQPPTLFLGDDLTLGSGVAGSPPITLQWRLNGTNIAGATNDFLAFNGLQASQSGTYTLVASNQYGPPVTNNAITLNVEPFLQFSWSPPAPITTADVTLGIFPFSNVLAAVDFGGEQTYVTLTNGDIINFTGDQSVASVNGNGTFEGAYDATTGNSDFDSVLDGANYDDGPKEILITTNLTPGDLFAVQLFCLDDRSPEDQRQMYFQDPSDTNNVSATYTNGANNFLIATFVANGTNQIITEQLPGIPGNDNVGSGNANALVLYSLPQAAEAWQPLTASPGVENDAGVIVTLSEALLTGIPPITYQWKSNGVAIPGATNSVFSFAGQNTSSSLSVSNSYSLAVANSFGTNTSPPITIIVTPAAGPSFTTNVAQPPILFLNDALTLISAVAGSPPISLQWQLNGTNIAGATNATLTLPALQASQAGVYTLVASNTIGSLANNPVNLTVEPFTQFSWSLPAPITTADATLIQIGTLVGAVEFGGVDTTVTLSDGTNIDFTGDTSVASVTGNGQYGGFLDGIALTTNANFNTVLSGANYDDGPKTITINATLTPGNLYAVQLFGLEDRWGDDNDLGTVPIPERRIFFQDPNDTNNVTQDIEEGANDFVVGMFMANATNQIIIEQTPGIAGDQGDIGSGNANAMVLYSVPQAANAWFPPTASPSSTVPVGTTVTLSETAVTGLPPFSYQWQIIAGGVTNSIAGATNSVLVLTNVPAVQPGSYALRVSNKSGTNTSPPLALDVENGPLFTADGAGWTLNGGASISNGVLTLTDNGADQQTSFFFDTPLYVGAFKTSFTYQATGTNPIGDGMTFCLQNAPGGPVIVGGAGGELGFGGFISSSYDYFTNSAAVAFNINEAYTNGYAFVVNGELTSTGPAGGYSATGSVNLGSGDPIKVGITYNGNEIALSLVDTTNSKSFTANITVGPLGIPSILGANTAYVGFTAGTDGTDFSLQTVSNFTFAPLVPLSAELVSTNKTVTISWPTAVGGGYVLQSSTNLVQGWTTVPPPYTVVNGQYQVTEPATGIAFYRLELP